MGTKTGFVGWLRGGWLGREVGFVYAVWARHMRQSQGAAFSCPQAHLIALHLRPFHLQRSTENDEISLHGDGPLVQPALVGGACGGRRAVLADPAGCGRQVGGCGSGDFTGALGRVGGYGSEGFSGFCLPLAA